MPCIIVHRNFSVEKEKAGLLQDRLCSVIEDVLHKPEAYIMVILDEPKAIRFGGSDEPAIFVEVKSLGLPGDSTSRLSSEICKVAEDFLSVPKDRVYIEFTDSPRSLWGWNGGTF